jgi:hypothetical protein
VAGALLGVLAACGGGGGGGGNDGDRASSERTFSEDAYAISFKYPSYLTEGKVTEVAESAGGEPVAQTALAIDEANAIFLAKYEVNAEVTGENIATFAPQVDELVQQLTGRPARGQTTEVGGLPAIRYEEVDLRTPPEGKSRLVFLFDGAVEYLVNCQSTPEERDAINRGCDRVLTTMSRA